MINRLANINRKAVFKKYNLSGDNIPPENITHEYTVDHDQLPNELWMMGDIGSHLWTPEIIQELIDDSKGLTGEEEIEFTQDGSHLFMIIDKDEVYLYSAKSTKKEQDYIWAFDDFIDFMEQFKTFIEENS